MHQVRQLTGLSDAQFGALVSLRTLGLKLGSPQRPSGLDRARDASPARGSGGEAFGGDGAATQLAGAVGPLTEPDDCVVDLDEVRACVAEEGSDLLPLEGDGVALGVVLVVIGLRLAGLDDAVEVPGERLDLLAGADPLQRERGAGVVGFGGADQAETRRSIAAAVVMGPSHRPCVPARHAFTEEMAGWWVCQPLRAGTARAGVCALGGVHPASGPAPEGCDRTPSLKA